LDGLYLVRLIHRCHHPKSIDDDHHDSEEECQDLEETQYLQKQVILDTLYKLIGSLQTSDIENRAQYPRHPEDKKGAVSYIYERHSCFLRAICFFCIHDEIHSCYYQEYE